MYAYVGFEQLAILAQVTACPSRPGANKAAAAAAAVAAKRAGTAACYFVC